MARKGAANGEPQLPADGMPEPVTPVHMSFGGINTHLPPVAKIEDYIGTQILGLIRGRIVSSQAAENASGVRKTNVTVVCEITPITPKQMIAAMGEGWEFPAEEKTDAGTSDAP